MAEGKIGEFTWKPPASKEELEGGPFGIIGGVNTETLPTHSMLHLQIRNREMIWESMITEGNKQKKQGHFWPWFRLLAIDQKPIFLTTYEFSIFVYSIPKEKDMIGISIITQKCFPQLQCMILETNSITL
jgi:hypothetical protein